MTDNTTFEAFGMSNIEAAQGIVKNLDAISTIQNISGPEFTLRYNEYRAAQINGSAAPGYSSYQAMNALEETFRQTMPSSAASSSGLPFS